MYVKSFQILAGLPDTIDTYGIVSGLWTSVFALGAFVGGEVVQYLKIQKAGLRG